MWIAIAIAGLSLIFTALLIHEYRKTLRKRGNLVRIFDESYVAANWRTYFLIGVYLATSFTWTFALFFGYFLFT